jgi:hypothetical protein
VSLPTKPASGGDERDRELEPSRLQNARDSRSVDFSRKAPTHFRMGVVVPYINNNIII